MSKKMKGVVLDSMPAYGVGGYDKDSKARLKHQILMEDYSEMEKEAYLLRSKLEDAKQRKLTLAAEVRFLRRRHKYLLKMNSPQEQHLVQPTSMKQVKNIKKNHMKEASRHKLPPLPDSKSRKKYNRKEAAPYHADLIRQQIIHGGKNVPPQSSTPVIDSSQRGRSKNFQEPAFRNARPVDLNQETYSANNAHQKKSIPMFDLNQDSSSLTSRAPMFDLNEISTEDEDMQSNSELMKFEEAQKDLIRSLSDEQQNEFNLAVCRNAGESSSRVGKRKISWQDPVALRV